MTAELLGKVKEKALQDIPKARMFRQPKIGNWQKNEEMYYASDKKILESRSSVQLSRMQEFVHTLLSKIDNPLVFKFKKRKNSQTKRVERLNALRQIDQELDNWDIKDIVGKKQAIIYGRAVYAYYADSIKGQYRAHLEPIDVYDFLIDPDCGGIDIEQADHLGSYSVSLNRKQLEKLKDDPNYIKDEIETLLQGEGNGDEGTQEETNKRSRTYDQNTQSKQLYMSKGKWKFWRWCTTLDGQRYYLLMTNSGAVIRCQELEEVFPVTDEYPQAMWPYWTWAAFPDLTEFWTPSYCDFVREVLMAQDVAVNQALDNGEAVNRPMKVVNVSAVQDAAQLKYRRDGLIKVVGEGVDVTKMVQFMQVPSIKTPIEIFNLLETIWEKASGVTSQQKGVEDVQGKVGIYEGNEAAAADRFGLLNKSYSFGYKRFARLYEMGVRDNLVRKVSVEIMGPAGIELAQVKRDDIFKKNDSYAVMTEASNAEQMASEKTKQTKLAFLSSKAKDPNSGINKKKATEIEAEIAGFTQDQIDDLMDTTGYGNAYQLSDADADIEALLFGEKVTPNLKANNAYKQHIVNYLINHTRELKTDEFVRISRYVEELDAIIMTNEARALQADVDRTLAQQAQGGMPQRPPMVTTPAPSPYAMQPAGAPMA